jgi:ATP-dependent helicase/nuclease subunit B
VDGFAEFCAQELELLANVAPLCARVRVTFCLESLNPEGSSWLSSRSSVRRSFEECRKRLGGLPDCEVTVAVLARNPAHCRFAGNAALRHLEECWDDPRPCSPEIAAQVASRESPLSVLSCADPEAEVVAAAREIRQHVRRGGRYRDVNVLVRSLEQYHQSVQRVFTRFDIPFFLDRRESVAHHPLAELTRGAIRTVAYQWRREDWFAALKTGLAPASEEEVDRLENEALARGWQGAVWQQPIVVSADPALTQWLSRMQQQLMPPFQRLALDFAEADNRPTGAQLAEAIRALWTALDVEEKLRNWTDDAPGFVENRMPASVHATVWSQMNTWLANLEMAFASEALSLRDWLPILEAGLANLTVGLIPPALDQAQVGSVERSRNPDVKLAIILGLNETVFPAPPPELPLFSDAERVELERRSVFATTTVRLHLSRERFHAYTAFTRARSRLLLTVARADADGTPLNPSPLLTRLAELFPSLRTQVVPQARDWRESEHVDELLAPMLKAGVANPESGSAESWEALRRSVPALAAPLQQLAHICRPADSVTISAVLARKLYGPALRTSVSRLEHFAACPFKFFVHSGLRAEERMKFELDAREQGSFQHELLALFHEELRKRGLRWRDLTPEQAREEIVRIAEGWAATYREGLMYATEQSRFLSRVMIESLQDFVETLVDWMRRQYQFDPVLVELPFGSGEEFPAWSIDLGEGRSVQMRGRIDRIDLFREPDGETARCVVIDYKSSDKKLDPVLIDNGLQLQLLAYLSVLRHCLDPRQLFGISRLIPSGVFYVNIQGKYESSGNRKEALDAPQQARKRAYRHVGRFDVGALSRLDSREGVTTGDQFNYRLTKKGELDKRSREPMQTDEFARLTDSVAANIKAMALRVFAGETTVAPYRKGSLTACKQCQYQPVCRMDPWTQSYRVLRAAGNAAESQE